MTRIFKAFAESLEEANKKHSLITWSINKKQFIYVLGLLFLTEVYLSQSLLIYKLELNERLGIERMEEIFITGIFFQIFISSKKHFLEEFYFR